MIVKLDYVIGEICYTISGRMAIHAMKVEGFHSNLEHAIAEIPYIISGRMAIHAMKVKDFHSNLQVTVRKKRVLWKINAIFRKNWNKYLLI